MAWLGALQAFLAWGAPAWTPATAASSIGVAGVLGTLTVLVYRLGVWRQEFENTKDRVAVEVKALRVLARPQPASTSKARTLRFFYSSRHLHGRATEAARMMDQRKKGERFRELHAGPGAFLIPNPWDAGTARILQTIGFDALTTTSAGLAFALGKRDGAREITRDEALANAKAIVDATHLPVAADLENGYGDAPEDAATTIRLAGTEVGLVGASIEDATGDSSRPIYDLGHATERIAAAVEAARALPVPFVLVARAENFLHGRPDLDDTIRRLQAFEAAGADALYAPGLTTLEQIRILCSAVRKPVNVVMGLKAGSFSVAELAAAGVRRISVGSALSRAAFTAFISAAREMKTHGTFQFAESVLTSADVSGLMQQP